MSYLDRVRACRRFEPSHFRRFVAGGLPVGWVKHEFARCLAAFPHVFTVHDDRAELKDCIDGFEARSEAMESVLRTLAERGDIPTWRDEPYAVVTRWGAAPLLRMDRAATPCFGVPGFGIHVNGHVDHGSAARLWIGRRSEDSYTDPGKLDHVVAGGMPFGLGVRENLAKEAEEEAGIPRALADRAQPVGAISYRLEFEWGVRNDTLFLFDLEVPTDFEPHNRDGEMASFECWPIDRVKSVVRDEDAFKFNVGLVIVDFLVRHGHLGPDDAGYLDLVRALHGST